MTNTAQITLAQAKASIAERNNQILGDLNEGGSVKALATQHQMDPLSIQRLADMNQHLS